MRFKEQTSIWRPKPQLQQFISADTEASNLHFTVKEQFHELLVNPIQRLLWLLGMTFANQQHEPV